MHIKCATRRTKILLHLKVSSLFPCSVSVHPRASLDRHDSLKKCPLPGFGDIYLQMQDPDDHALLDEYVQHHSEEAFAQLVARHVNKVYSVALRHTRNPHHAEEITQTVFVLLAQKSPTMGKNVILSGWLYQTARLMATTLVRSEIRRAHREQEAHMQTRLNEPEPDAWPRIEPMLDEAMAGLGTTDRDAIVLRFFDGCSMQQVGAALGASEDAAKKRVTRAVEKLRSFFTRRGVALSATALIVAISTNAAQAAPATLAQTVTAAALAKGALAATSTLAVAKGTVKMTGLKMAIAAALIVNAFLAQQRVASHFDIHGRPDAWMSPHRYLLVSLLIGVGLPLFLIAIGYVVRFLPATRVTFKIPNRDYWLTPERRGEVDAILFHFCLWVACLEAVFMLILHLLVVYANQLTPPHLGVIESGASWLGILTMMCTFACRCLNVIVHANNSWPVVRSPAGETIVGETAQSP
ncbi:RNA polymerase sigma factor (sigma-70 family) [Chthoniobacter flavus]|uniref:sigma-70 family RNA polymerase sigma factor n=1 Tax=Chthoniobacter flavus TaxID=191863 RepID=UPI00104CB46E|nr:RNA polymerase sigma factor (sigma-70 family) [Chthoniobacter flavus]